MHNVIGIGAGTTMWPFVRGEKATPAAILQPVRMGTRYKHLDTLAAYRQKQSEPSAGKIMAVMLQEKKQQEQKSTGVGKLVTDESHKKEMAAILGMGTACYPFSGGKHAKLAVLNAIKLGYRHFDTAVLYQTEQPIGEAISEALRLGFIKSRAELFIVSKLWCADAHPGLVIPALQNTLRKLQLDYLDAYLIHWPVSMTPGKYILPLKCKDDLVPMDYESVWAEMEVCQKLGLTKSIGVSNFSRKKLETILATAEIPPAVNLTEVNPHWQQKTLLEFCKVKGIAVRASSPLGGKGTLWGSDRIMECEVIRKIAKAKGKTHAQICLRWAYEQGVSLLVKSFNEQRMKENMEIFDWELNADELKLISEIPQRRGLPGHIFVSPTGPFKTEQELWDELI